MYYYYNYNSLFSPLQDFVMCMWEQDSISMSRSTQWRR